MISSLLHINDAMYSLGEVQDWIKHRNKEVDVNLEQIPFSQMLGWHIDNDGCLRHETGRFFSVEGIRVQTDFPCEHMWEQPIINQPEIGYLGILTKKFDGILYFLMQAKIEPGNVNCVQISPTLQATKSNYTRVHGGNKTAYLDYFRNAKPEQIVLDQLQSEQGARFLRKRNRNIIINVEDEVPVFPNFIWITLGQIKELMQIDNCVNMDTRTVISSLDFSEYEISSENLFQMSDFGREMLDSAKCTSGLNTIHEVLSWLTNLKACYDLSILSVPMNRIADWVCTDTEIVRPDHKYFRIIGVNVSIDNREVKSWCQPMVQPMQQGICAFVLKKINGIYHFLVQAKMECGNHDIFEMAPTVQCLTGNVYTSMQKPAYTDYVLNARRNQIIYDTLQSEEGGRFYHEQNRNMLVVADDYFTENVPPTYQWLTLHQINEFLKYNNYLNIQARSLIAAIKYV